MKRKRFSVEQIVAVFARDWAETPAGKKAVKKTTKKLKAGKPLPQAGKLLAAAALL